MISMTYFADSSPLSYALLLLGLALAVAAVVATARTVTFRVGSPPTVADRLSFRVTGYTGAGLMSVGAAPLLISMSF
jgi:hypothetical protein